MGVLRGLSGLLVLVALISQADGRRKQAQTRQSSLRSGDATARTATSAVKQVVQRTRGKSFDDDDESLMDHESIMDLATEHLSGMGDDDDDDDDSDHDDKENKLHETENSLKAIVDGETPEPEDMQDVLKEESENRKERAEREKEAHSQKADILKEAKENEPKLMHPKEALKAVDKAKMAKYEDAGEGEGSHHFGHGDDFGHHSSHGDDDDDDSDSWSSDHSSSHMSDEDFDIDTSMDEDSDDTYMPHHSYTHHGRDSHLSGHLVYPADD